MECLCYSKSGEHCARKYSLSVQHRCGTFLKQLILPGQKVPHRSVKLSAYFAASGELVDIGETITKSKMHDFEFFQTCTENYKL